MQSLMMAIRALRRSAMGTRVSFSVWKQDANCNSVQLKSFPSEDEARVFVKRWMGRWSVGWVTNVWWPRSDTRPNSLGDRLWMRMDLKDE